MASGRDDRRRAEAAKADVFGYSAGDLAGQGLRNMLALMAMPFALAMMLQSEMIAEAMRAFGD